MPETDVAKAVVAWLQGLRWTVYQEVQVSSYGRTADIVAVNHHALWVVESKLCLSIDVIEQALRWAGNAHYISVAVPAGTRRSSQLFSGNLIHAVLAWQRVGLLLVNQDEVTETVHPLIRRRINPHPLRDALCVKQQTFAPAGNADNQRWSPFKQTCEQIAAAVHDRPGVTTTELLGLLRHHWRNSSTAESNLFRLGLNDGVAGVKMMRDNHRIWRWYPVADGKIPLTKFL